MLKLPEPIVMNYPDARHVNVMRWTRPDDHGRVFAAGAQPCSEYVQIVDVDDEGPVQCRACSKLANEAGTNGLAKLVTDAADKNLHKSTMNHTYLTRLQLTMRLQMHKKKKKVNLQ